MLQAEQKRLFNVKMIVLGLYFIITYCSIFNLIQIELQLVLFALVSVFHLDKIKLRSIFWVSIITGLNIISFVFAKNYNFGFWDPINFVMNYISLFQVFVLYDIFLSLKKKNKKVILNLVLVSVLITNFISIYYNLGDAYAIRYRPSHYIFIMTFSQYYSLPMLISTILTKTFYEKKINLLTLLTLISSIVVLVIGNLVTGLVLGGLSSFLVLLFWLSKSSRFKQVITLISTILMALFLRTPIANLIRKISTLDFLSTLASSKLLVAALVLEGGERSSTLITRQEYSQAAMNSFKANPLFGIPYNEYRFGTVSNHADWYDILAVNGIIGLGFLIIVLIDFSIIIFNNLKSETEKTSFFISLVIFIILGFLNPSFTVEILLMTFIVSSNISNI